MIVAEIPFECPECGRPYHMKVDLLKLTRLNRIAVCGRCKHQFNVEVKLDEGERSTTEDGHPFRLRPSTPPPISSPGQGPRPIRRRDSGPVGDSMPPLTSGSYAAASPDEGDTLPGDQAPVSGPRTRRGVPSPRSRHPSWPQTEASTPSRRRDSKWPIAKPRLGWSRDDRDDRDHDTEPSLPSFEVAAEPAAEERPSWPDLELDVSSSPPSPSDGGADSRKRKDSLLRKRKEIVVQVGDGGAKSRSRRTYRPENLITQPGGYRPDRAQNGDDEG